MLKFSNERSYGTERTYATEEGSGQADHDPDSLWTQDREPYEVTIWFAPDDDKLYIGTANLSRQWVRNVQKTPKIRLCIGGETFDGNARLLTDRAEHERAMAAIRRTYWIFIPCRQVES